METVSTKNLQHDAERLLVRLRASGGAVRVTEEDRPVAVLVAADTYAFMLQRLALLEGLLRGEEAIREGCTVTHAEARAKMDTWL